MRKGTTPTIILTLPEGIDLGLASHVFVTLTDTSLKKLVEISDNDLAIDENEGEVFLPQETTLALPSQVYIQVNWTYTEADGVKRACTEIAALNFGNNLKNEVI